MTTFWVVWDAAAVWVVDALVSEGALPAVAALREQGVWASARPPRPNCQTPPALATLFTGKPLHEHGVTGFWVPGGAGGSLRGQVRAFTPGVCRSPMVWDEAAALGVRSSFAHVPWVFDSLGGVGPNVDVAIEAYSRRRARSGVIDVADAVRRPQEVSAELGPFELLLSVGADVSVRFNGGEVRLTLGGGWECVRLSPGCGVWLSAMAIGDDVRVLHSGIWEPQTGGSCKSLATSLSTASVFCGEGLGEEYRTGRLGTRLVDGGNGRAEELFMSSVELAARCFSSTTAALLRECPSDLVVIYAPMTDDVGHELLGVCDPTSAAFQPEAAGEAWAHVRRCYQWADSILSQALQQAGPNDTVVLSSDHGMCGVAKEVFPNVCLAAAGLARPDPDPEVGANVDTSDVWYHLANNGLMLVNSDTLTGGHVAAVDAPATLRRAMRQLEALVDPATGASVVGSFVDELGASIDSERSESDHAYVIFADGYLPSADMPSDGSVFARSGRSAAHIGSTGNPHLDAVFAAAGPGLSVGADLGVIDNAEVASLVLSQHGRLLGLASA